MNKERIMEDLEETIVMHKIVVNIDDDLIPKLKLIGLRMIIDDEEALISYAAQKILEKKIEEQN